MGSWSVYCGLSKITITEGTRCVLLPLFKSKGVSESHDTYPYSLPIFGEYNDYGEIGNILEDFNTRLIEKVFGVEIQEFCDVLTRKDIESTDEALEEKLKGVSYMWIHGDVYDFLKDYHPNGFSRKGDFDMGNPKLLEALGFEYVGETTGKSDDDKRYNKIYKLGEKTIQSDGTWLHKKGSSGIYSIGALKRHFPSIDITKYKDVEEQNLYEILDIKTLQQKFGWVLGMDRYVFSGLEFDDIFERMKELIPADKLEEAKSLSSGKSLKGLNLMQKEYVFMFDNMEFLSRLADLRTITKNIHSYSQWFEFYQLYQTPQCGEFEIHQGILDAFAKINRKIVKGNRE